MQIENVGRFAFMVGVFSLDAVDAAGLPLKLRKIEGLTYTQVYFNTDTS